MRKILFTLTGLIFLIPVSVNGQENNTTKKLSFEEALSLTQQNSLVVKQAQQNIDQKEKEKEATIGLFMPKVSLTASYIYMSDDIHLDLNPVRNAITPLYGALGQIPVLPPAVQQKFLSSYKQLNAMDWNQTIQKKQFGIINAGFTMPLYTGGKIRTANKAAKIKLSEAKIDSKIKFQKLSHELIERYYGLVLAYNAKKIRKDVLATMDHHLNDANKLMSEGIIAKAEYLHAKVYHSAAEREFKKAERQVHIINDALLNTIALDNSTSITPMSSLFYTNNIESIEYYWDKAITNNSLLEKIDTKKQLAHQAHKIERSEFFPTIAAMGTYELYDKDFSPYIPEYMVGVGLKWNLFSGTERIKKLKASKIREMQVETFYQKAESDIKTAVTKYYQEIQMNLEQLKELESALEFATEYYRVRENAFKEGMATTTEVSDASLAVAKVKIERLQVMYAFDIALSNLLFYSGISDEFINYMSNSETIYESY
ncbi:MAG: TolC family protein [Bacteroidales bacterium]|nr:TolC family protein [Bacteroidales bacterium]